MTSWLVAFLAFSAAIIKIDNFTVRLIVVSDEREAPGFFVEVISYFEGEYLAVL